MDELGSNIDEATNLQTSREYLCVFCKTGKELGIATHIMEKNPQTQAYPVQQLKRFSKHGETERHLQIIFPGYVFIEVMNEHVQLDIHGIDGLLRVLRQEQSGFLCGSDREFAKWIVSQQGILGFSKAFEAGKRVQIIEGPLKRLEGQIVKVDKRNKNALVELGFGTQIIKAWLGYDLVAST